MLRFCECGRTLDKYQHICSECSYHNKRMSIDIYLSDKDNYKKHQESTMKWQKKNYKSRDEWKNMATRCKYVDIDEAYNLYQLRKQSELKVNKRIARLRFDKFCDMLKRGGYTIV